MSEKLKRAEDESEARGKLLERLRRAVGGDTWEQAVSLAETAVEERASLQEALSAVVEHSEYEDGELHVDMDRVASVLEVEPEDAMGELETRAWKGSISP